MAIAVAAVAGTCLTWVGFTPGTSLALAMATGLAAAALGAAVVWTARRLLWACRWRLERAIVTAVGQALAGAPWIDGEERRADGDAAPSMATIAHSIASLRRDLAAFERTFPQATREGPAGQAEGRLAGGGAAQVMPRIAQAIDSLRGELAGIERRLGEGLSRARYEIEEGKAMLVDLADRAEKPSDPRSGG